MFSFQERLKIRSFEVLLLLPQISYIADSPVCRTAPVVVGVSHTESVSLECQVESNPESGIKFHWVFNHTLDSPPEEQEEVLVPYVTNGTRSVLTYAPGPRSGYKFNFYLSASSKYLITVPDS